LFNSEKVFLKQKGSEFVVNFIERYSAGHKHNKQSWTQPRPKFLLTSFTKNPAEKQQQNIINLLYIISLDFMSWFGEMFDSSYFNNSLFWQLSKLIKFNLLCSINNLQILCIIKITLDEYVKLILISTRKFGRLLNTTKLKHIC
jgi:hypothetical protein